jgi:hypothetical protein
MLPHSFDPFREVWTEDFEFTPVEGGLPKPICLVASELRSGRTVRMWEDELRRASAPPYALDSRALLVTYVAQAELSCHLALGWSFPVHVLDIYTEFRTASNGIYLEHGKSLVGALAFYRLDAVDAGEKKAWQALAVRGGPWTAEERAGLLSYCESDVRAEIRLLQHMAPSLHLPGAL